MMCAVMRRGALQQGVFALLLLACASSCAVQAHSVAGHANWEDSELDYVSNRRKNRARWVQMEATAEAGRLMDEYMHQGMKKVMGWFDPQALLALRVISRVQISSGVSGGVVEIGVHHGKSFIPLCILNSDAGDNAGIVIAIDVFEDQLLNPDGSGQGNASVLAQNVRSWCGEANAGSDRFGMMQADSRVLTAEQVLRHLGSKARIFSIDGSHTADATYADLTTASRCLVEGGLIAIDDMFAEGWPGVSEGVFRFMMDQDIRLAGGESDLAIVPFFIGFNKVFFTHEGYAGQYMQELMDKHDDIGDIFMVKETQVMYGHAVVNFLDGAFCKRASRELIPGQPCPEGMVCKGF